MRLLRPVLLVLGIVCVAMGVLWIGQGLGYVRWPASSFMIGVPEWSTRGLLLAVGGILLIFAGRRR